MFYVFGLVYSYEIFSEFDRFLLSFSKNKQKIFFLTVGQIFFKLKFSKFIQNFRALNVFGRFLLIVYPME